MRSSRSSLSFRATRFLCAAGLACTLFACGSAEVVNRDDTGVAGGAGGQGGNGSSGTSFDFPDGGPMSDAGSMDIPEAGPGCGDGLVNQPSEECDDGNTVPGDGCSGACTKEDNSQCPPKGGPCTSTIKCGDGVIEASEACDDGNTIDGDGCSSDCLVKDPNYDCPVLAQMCINLNVCGDGKVTGDENCDDGNQVSKDGCSADCSTVEDGYICGKPGPGSCRKAVIPVCGDGVLDVGEDCDDGNTSAAADGCSATCTIADGLGLSRAGLGLLAQGLR